MVYDLGIDVGTSYTAAAIRRTDGTIEVVGLGPIADNIPSVVYLNDDGSLIVGDAAARRAAIDPAGAAREFKRRLGDPTPLILRTSPFSAEALIAKMIDHVTARVTDRERDRPRHTVVTHPANWGPYKLELFDQAFRIANVEDHSRLPEPQAAAMAYAAEARVPTGSVVAVYDLGGGTFDAAVLRKTDTGFEALGESVGIEHLGGVDFDEAVLHHVRTQVGDRWPDDPNDPSLPAPMLHLRRACMEARAALHRDGGADPGAAARGGHHHLARPRPVRGDDHPRLEDSISALEAAIGSAGVGRDQLNAVLLVGGSSRIPLVARMLRDRFGDAVAGDIDPLYCVARAALAAGVAAGDTAGSGSFFAGPAAPAAPAPGVPQPASAPPTVVAASSAPPPPVQPAPVAPAPVAPARPLRPPPPRSCRLRPGRCRRPRRPAGSRPRPVARRPGRPRSWRPPPVRRWGRRRWARHPRPRARPRRRRPGRRTVDSRRRCPPSPSTVRPARAAGPSCWYRSRRGPAGGRRRRLR
ncbi:MAG: Hsp70 family protein [Acidimicrobiales bacterium]